MIEMFKTENKSLEEILKGSPANAKFWWRSVNAGKTAVPSDFNWHLFTSEIVVNAYRYYKKNDEKLCLEWAELAILLEETLAKSDDIVIVNSSEMTAMRLRANLICKFGHIDGHFILDTNTVIKWFYSKLEISSAELIKEEKNWWKISHEERIRTLKENPEKQIEIMYVKNRLDVIVILENCQSAFIDGELRGWLAARKHL